MQERFSYAPFVIPFTVGLIYIISYFAFSFIKLLHDLSWADRNRFFRSIFSYKLFVSAW